MPSLFLRLSIQLILPSSVIFPKYTSDFITTPLKKFQSFLTVYMLNPISQPVFQFD